MLNAKEYIYDLNDKTLGIISHGHFVIRGENVGLLGQCIDDASDSRFTLISSEEALDKQHRKLASGYEKICKDSKKLLAIGFCPMVSFSGGDKTEYFYSL